MPPFCTASFASAANAPFAIAITINPDATIPAASRLMSAHRVKRLPVVDRDGVLAGIVGRRDLLSVFLRRDEEIAEDVRGIFTDILCADPDALTVAVKGGIVTLTGQPAPADERDLLAVAIRLTWDIDGVVDVENRLTAGPRD